MTTRLPLFSLPLSIILALLIGISMRIGQRQATPERIARLHLADCALPCWNGITPGVSSIAEAKARIDAALPDFQSPSLTNAASSKFLIWTQYGDIDRVVQVVDVIFQDSVVTAIGIGTDHTSSDMPRLSEVLMVYGSPTCATMDARTGNANLFYENSAQHYTLQFSVFPLTLTTPVNNFVFGVPNDEATCQNISALSWHDFRILEPSFLRLS